MENHHFLTGKSTISMAILNSYVTNYQRVYLGLYQWPFQDPRLEVPTIYKAYFLGLCKGTIPAKYGQKYGMHYHCWDQRVMFGKFLCAAPPTSEHPMSTIGIPSCARLGPCDSIGVYPPSYGDLYNQQLDANS